MGHYKTDATRAEVTPSEWLSVGAQIGSLANDWSERSDIVAFVGPGAGGPAPACFIPASAEIEVNVDVAFGYGVEPSDIDLTTRRGRYEFPRAVGAVFHEACHARFSRWDMKQAHSDLAKDEYEALILLEESRIEFQGLRFSPKMEAFLEACALEIVVADASEQFAGMSNTQAAAQLVGLVWTRVDAGILRLDDVREVTDLIDDYLGLDVVSRLRDIALEFQSHTNHYDVSAVYPLAQEWARLVRETAEEKGDVAPPPCDRFSGMASEGEESEGGEGSGEGDEESEGEGSGIGEIVEKMLDALADAADAVAISNADSLEDAEQAEKYEEVVKEKAEKAKEVKNAKAAEGRVFGAGTGAGYGASHSRIMEKRAPLPEERRAANIVATMLEKAKYRDRDVTEVASVLPPGRLRARAMVQGAAMRERGIMQQPEAWRRKVRKHTDEPTLSVGVLVDISGSMGAAMEPMATTAYVLSEATHRVQGKGAMVYYGNGVFPTLRVGERMSEVRVYTAPDGTEKFDEAFRAIDGALNLLHGDGARLLVIVSDGVYTYEETAKAKRWMQRCAEQGVAVVWLPFDHGAMAKDVGGEHSVVLGGAFSPTDAAQKIGQACADAITRTATRRVAA